MSKSFNLMFILTVPDKGVGRCLGPEVNGVSSGEGGEEGPSPQDKKQDKQSTPSKEGDNMEREEEGKKSQA
jgi:hypothetical protein